MWLVVLFFAIFRIMLLLLIVVVLWEVAEYLTGFGLFDVAVGLKKDVVGLLAIDVEP